MPCGTARTVDRWMQLLNLAVVTIAALAVEYTVQISKAAMFLVAAHDDPTTAPALTSA
jgi:hypothetical protein